MKEIEETNDKESSFYKEVGGELVKFDLKFQTNLFICRICAVNNLIDLLMNLFAAGSDTTTATLCWGFLYLLKYPSVYAKWKSELDRIVGKGNLPTLMDRPK